MQKLTLTSPTSGAPSRTQATEFEFDINCEDSCPLTKMTKRRLCRVALLSQCTLSTLRSVGRTTREPPSILWNPKVHLRVQKSSPLVPVPSQTNPVHTSPTYLSKLSTHLRFGLPSELFPTGFHRNNLYDFLSSRNRATCPVHLILYLIFAKSKSCEAPRYAVFSTLLSRHPSSAKYSPQHPKPMFLP
jgi:hypothetical protein